MKKDNEIQYHIQSWIDARLENLEKNAKYSLWKYRFLITGVLLSNTTAIVLAILGATWLINYNVDLSSIRKFMAIAGAIVITLLFILQGINILYKSRMTNIIFEDGKSAVIVEHAKYVGKIDAYKNEDRDEVFSAKLDEIETSTYERVAQRRKKSLLLKFMSDRKLKEIEKRKETNENN